VQGIHSIVLRQRIRFAVQRIDFGIGDAVRDSSDCFSEERCVVRDVLRLFGERLDNVGFPHEERLDDGAEREELERCGGRHFVVAAAVETSQLITSGRIELKRR